MDTEFRWTGKPGEQVPVVDPADVRSVWEAHRELEKQFPPSSTGLTAVTGGKAKCSESADVRAVGYRTVFLSFLISHSPEVAAHVEGDAIDDNLCRAIAEVEMTWIAEAGQTGLPFDEEEFMTRLRGEQVRPPPAAARLSSVTFRSVVISPESKEEGVKP
jgi:hypothetical protein